MASPRRPYFRIEDTVLSRQWSNDQLASLVRLIAHMHTRWARENPEDPCMCWIGPEDAMRITRKRRPDAAMRALESLAEIADLTVDRGDIEPMSRRHRADIEPTSDGHRADVGRMSSERRADIASIRWPNLAKIQGWKTRKVPPTDTETDTETETETETRCARVEEPGQKAGFGAAETVEPRGQVTLAAGADRLSPKRIADLLAVRPRGILYHENDVAIWYAATAPRMRANGRKDLWRTALAWWPRVTSEEISEAYRWANNRALQDSPRVAVPEGSSEAQDSPESAVVAWGSRI